MSSLPPVPARRGRGLSPAERRELREAALTVVPAVVLAVVLRWALVAYAGWGAAPRDARRRGLGAHARRARAAQPAAPREELSGVPTHSGCPPLFIAMLRPTHDLIAHT
jgi:hypothetical protein